MAGIKLKFDFSGLLEALQEAGGDVDAAAAEIANESGEIVANELRSAAASSGVPSIAAGVRHTVDGAGSKYTVKAGWEMNKSGSENLSVGQLAAIFNYGTPERFVKKKNVRVQINGSFKTLSLSRGKIAGRGFIQKAKKSSAPKVKAAQKEALNKMLARLR